MISPAFSVVHRDRMTAARVGRLTTPHGTIRTPAFAPVGSQATVKTLTPDELARLGVDVIMTNAYHLTLRPGHEVIARLGGLHHFMQWNGALMTDSGGYQAMSLGGLARVDDDGVTFQSHLDGSHHRLTPETATEIQQALGADIMMTLDDCTPYPATRARTLTAMERSARWAGRCRAIHLQHTSGTRPGPMLFGVVQGGFFTDLRKQAAADLVELGFDGYAVGGLSVGETPAMRWEVLETVVPLLPEDRPRHLLGVGFPEDLVEGVAMGTDLFDCVIPTRHARTGSLFTSRGRLVLTHARYADDPGPIDPDCPCEGCRRFSRAYLRHLFEAGEILAMRLNTVHNLTYYLRLMDAVRGAIVEGRFAEFRREVAARHHQEA